MLVHGRASPSENAVFDAGGLLGAPAQLTLHDADSARVVRGVVDALQALDRRYRFTVVPKLDWLGQHVDHRVFIDQDALEIAEALLGEHGLTLERRVQRTLPKRPQCVQVFESVLAFVQRILAEEGVTLFVQPGEDEEVLVAADHPEAHPPFGEPDELPWSEEHGEGLRAAAAVYRAELGRAMAPGKVSLTDFDPRHPAVDQAVQMGEGPLERYEYPGGYHDTALGAELAAMRLEEHRRYEDRPPCPFPPAATPPISSPFSSRLSRPAPCCSPWFAFSIWRWSPREASARLRTSRWPEP